MLTNHFGTTAKKSYVEIRLLRGAQKVCNIKGIYTEMSGGEVGRYL
jgi:hypothetical protein